MTTMRRLAADRLESMDRPKLLGGSERAARAAEQVPPDPAETLRVQSALAFDAAREQGLAKGLSDAESQVKLQVEAIATRLREEHAASLKRLHSEQDRLRNLATSLQEAVSMYATDAESLAVEVGFASVTRLLGEKSADRTLMNALCQRIVHEYGHPPATLRISEADLPLLASVELGIPVEADRRLAPGQCVIDTARGQFESGLDVRLDALRRTLLATVAEHRGQA
jgi:flagellar biosynthesis/type III secretory pathway protein FliH